MDDEFDGARAAGVLPNLHAVVAARAGDIFFERYLTDTDALRARPLGVVRFGPDTLHDVRSVTKGVVGLLYGIALSEGIVPQPEAVLVDQFPDYADLVSDVARRRITVAHALTMTMGVEWDELSIPYSDPRNSEIAMDRASDRIRFVLERKIVEPPGERWGYNGGATAVLARMISRGAGMSLQDYARKMLFAPLGIGGTEWGTGTDREALAASGLRMTARDLLRIGLVVLADGKWEGRQLVPAEWVAVMQLPAVSMPDGRRYGYQWYLGAVGMSDGAGDVTWERMVMAVGNGGQRLFLLPRLDVAVVVLAGNYDSAEQWRPPLAVLRDVILPGVGRVSGGI